MSIKEALAIALESHTDPVLDSEIQDKIEEAAATATPGTFNEYIGDLEEGHRHARLLDNIADKADAAISAGEATQISAESLTLAMESVLGRYKTSMESIGFESSSDPETSHRQIAAIARSTAQNFRDNLHVSQEGMSLKAFFSHLMSLEGSVKELKKLRDELKRNKEWYSDSAVTISHFGVYQYLTKGNKIVSDISGAVQDEVKSVNQLFKYGEELGKKSDEIQSKIENASLTSGDEVGELINYLDSLPSGGENIKPLNGRELLGNRTIVINSFETGQGGNQNLYYYAELDKEDAKPNNKAAWWARLGSGILGWFAGGRLGATAGTIAAAIIVGPPVSVGAFLAATIIKGFGAGYGIVKGVKAGLRVADKISSGLKTVSNMGIDDMIKALDEGIALGEKTLQMRHYIDGRHEKLVQLGKMNKEKLNSSGINGSLKKDFGRSLFTVDNYHWAEWNCYDVAIEQAVYDVENLVRIASKLVESTKN